MSSPSIGKTDTIHYIPRRLADIIPNYTKDYPAIAIVGPRQSGKTTLARKLFPDYPYYSLESLDHRRRAIEDPRQFLHDAGPRVILDEVQRAPELFSYLQEYVDDPSTQRQYILTGSQQFLLMEQITQSLAGRIVSFHLYPLSLDELYREAVVPDTVRTEELLLKGFYPRIHDRDLDPSTWYEGYVSTYIERDVRSILNVADVHQFETFLKILAGHSGQILNKSTISNRIGISVPTVGRWLSVLETSGILRLVQPYSRNLHKRLVKSPKLFFTDSGLLCYLLGIYTPGQLSIHPLYGSIFESFVASELMKRASHRGSRAGFYYWRDKSGHEIDLIIEDGLKVLPIEVKSAGTYTSSFAKNLLWWMDLPGNEVKEGMIIYDGDEDIGRGSSTPCISWRRMKPLAEESTI